MARRVVPKQLSFVRRVADSCDLGEVLRAERIRRGLSQEALGTLIGETRQKVQQLEAGAAGVAAGTVLRALGDLGVALVAIPQRPVGSRPGHGEDAASRTFDCTDELLRQLQADPPPPAARIRRTEP